MLTPVVFWTGPPLVGELGDQPVVLAYPAPTELTFRVGSESDTLAAILGSTRAAVLRLLAEQHTTGDIARTLGSVRRRRPNTPRRCGPPLARREVSAVPETIAQRRRRVAVSDCVESEANAHEGVEP